MVAVGHLVGYGVGTLDLIKIFGTTFGDSQFKQLIWIAALALIFSVGLTSWTVTERILLSAKEGSESGPFQMVTKIWRTALDLPPRIQAICWIQFWAWIGWFPFLFYSPTWVGETYFRYSAPPDIDKSPDKLGELGRIGSMSLVIFSIVTLGASIFLPWCISKPEDEKQPFTPRPPPVIASLITKIHENKPDLLTAWLGSHLIFSAAMLLAPLVRSLQFATALVSICGM
jgi:solute carrier family 45 protein 1/2/4